jgi:hypothetical protein
VSHSSDERFVTGDRAAVEPTAALVAVLVVGAGLGLYVTALDGATPTAERDDADAVIDRIEREATVGGTVRPGRIRAVTDVRAPTAVELSTETETWRYGVGGADPGDLDGIETRAGKTGDRYGGFAERRVTVRVAPGVNVRGRLRVVVRR